MFNLLFPDIAFDIYADEEDKAFAVETEENLLERGSDIHLILA